MQPRALLPAVFALALLASLLALAPLEALFDADSYFHLAVARHYAEAGFQGGLPWARFSAMRDAYGDKEILFHALLIPFATHSAPVQGGKLALALLNAAIATTLAALALRFVGAVGALLPFVLFAVSLDYSGRLLRLRPELLSLLLLLAAAEVVYRERDWVLGPLAVLYALSHTGVHALLLLAGAWFVAEVVVRRRWSFGLLVWPTLGAALGLAVHPQFPANLKIFWLQNVRHAGSAAALDLGREFSPLLVRDALIFNFGLWLLLGLLLLATRRLPVTAGGESTRRPFAVAALCFGVLYLLWLPRFALYLAPFASLAVLAELARRRPLPALTPRSRRLLLLSALAVSLSAVPVLAGLVRILESDLCFQKGRDDDARAFSRALPAGARVAAPWGATEWYVFWAPQARYLNVLDPVFMAVPFPNEHRLQEAVFFGREPDVPLAVAGGLASDFLAFPSHNPQRALDPRGGNDYPVKARLQDDPRVRLLHEGNSALYALRPGANGAFQLDWRFSPAARAPVPRAAADVEAWPRYGRLADPRLAAFEGYVDATRMAPLACARFARVERVDRALRVDWEFAPYGSGTLWLDGHPLAAVRGAGFALVGQGVVLPVVLSPGQHVVTVDTCPAEGRVGFYLLERRRAPAPETATAGNRAGTS